MNGPLKVFMNSPIWEIWLPWKILVWYTSFVFEESVAGFLRIIWWSFNEI